MITFVDIFAFKVFLELDKIKFITPLMSGPTLRDQQTAGINFVELFAFKVIRRLSEWEKRPNTSLMS